MPAACECDCHDGTRGPKRGNLARAMEQREAARRVQDAARQEINKYYAESKAVDAMQASMINDDFKRKGREYKERAAEANMLETLYQNERNKALATMRAEEEERLATVLARRQQEKDRSTREVQRLKEQSSELRELGEKIRLARANKERADQLVQKAALQTQQREYDEAFNQFVAQNEAAAAARADAEAARRKDNAIKTRMVLEEQMAERQDQLKEAEAQAARERAMVDEVVQRILDEDASEVALKRQKQGETKAYIENFLMEQDEARRAQKAAAQAEDRKITEYWQMVRDREAEEAARQAQRKEVADRMYEKVRKEMEDEMRRREEEEELINLLRQEELEEKRRNEEEAQRARAERMKQEMISANEYQMRMKGEREAALKREEEEFRQNMMLKFAEDDRLEQLNAQKRRMRVAEHAREVQRLIDERRRMFEEQRAAEEAQVAAQRAEDERQKAIIEGERRKLLAEAAQLKDYLPKGVLRDRADLEYMNNVLAGMSVRDQ